MVSPNLNPLAPLFGPHKRNIKPTVVESDIWNNALVAASSFCSDIRSGFECPDNLEGSTIPSHTSFPAWNSILPLCRNPSTRGLYLTAYRSPSRPSIQLLQNWMSLGNSMVNLPLSFVQGGSSTLFLAIGIGYWQSGNVWSAMANQDFFAHTTVNKDLVLNNLNNVFAAHQNYDAFEWDLSINAANETTLTLFL